MHCSNRETTLKSYIPFIQYGCQKLSEIQGWQCYLHTLHEPEI